MNKELKVLFPEDLFSSESSHELLFIRDKEFCPSCKSSIYHKESSFTVLSIQKIINSLNDTSELFDNSTFAGKLGNTISNPDIGKLFGKNKKEIKKKFCSQFQLSAGVLNTPTLHSCPKCKVSWFIHKVLAERLMPNPFFMDKNIFTSLFGFFKKSNLCSNILFLNKDYAFFPISPGNNNYLGTLGRISKNLLDNNVLLDAQNAISKGDLAKCFESLNKLSQSIDPEIKKSVEQLKFRFRQNELKFANGILPTSEYTIETNKVSNGLLNLIQSAKLKLL